MFPFRWLVQGLVRHTSFFPFFVLFLEEGECFHPSFFVSLSFLFECVAFPHLFFLSSV